MDIEEFEKEKELIRLKELSKMRVAEYIRETERLKLEWNKELQRIKTAEIRRTMRQGRDGHR